MLDFGKVLTAMVTPFARDLSVDFRKAADLAKRLIENGSDGVVVAGTTGEGPVLSKEEKLELFETVVGAVGDRAVVVANTGSNSTSDSIALTKAAEKIGAKAVMLVAPYYNKPPQEGLYQHFAAIAGETSLPILIYNVPGRTSVNILPETLVRLSKIANIQGVKEASGALDQASEIARAAEPGFQILSGDDSLTLPILAVGGRGIVSVASHVAGKQIRAMVEAYLAGRVAEARDAHIRLMPLFKACFVTTNPIPVKAALRLAGFDAGSCRLPLVEAGTKEVEAVRKAMGDLGLLAV
ncbi:MAG TPA: 4-hydroxy-tetrahydrodipicolinate synthase [Bacillota bacterium]